MTSAPLYVAIYRAFDIWLPCVLTHQHSAQRIEAFVTIISIYNLLLRAYICMYSSGACIPLAVHVIGAAAEHIAICISVQLYTDMVFMPSLH